MKSKKVRKGVKFFLGLLVLISGILCLIASGGGGGGGSSDDSGTETQGAGSEIVGLAQKGPFILGSDITIQELDDSLNSIGTQFTTEIINDLGEFTISPNLTSQYVEVIGDGYYYDEIAGDLSSGTLNLWAVADLDSGTEVNINVLTYLEKTRLKTLISQGKSFDEARAQAKSEVLAAFNISESNISDFDKMDISESGTSNAILLAVSSILLEMAHGNATYEISIPAELSETLSAIATDIGTDGSLDSQETKENICRASTNIDQEEVRNNLESRYASLGQTIVAPPFENYIDNDCYLDIYEKGPYPRIIIKNISLENPSQMAITPNGNYGYVTCDGGVQVINIGTNSVVENINFGVLPTGLAISPDGNFVYVTDQWNASVYVIQTSNNEVINTITGFDSPYNLAVTPDGNYAYVANSNSTVKVIQTSDNTLVDSIDLGVGLTYDLTITPNGNYVYVTDSQEPGNVHVIRVSDNSAISTISVGNRPYGISITPDGDYVYVANYVDQSISVIQTSDNTITTTIDLGEYDEYPTTVSVTPDGKYVYAAGGNIIYVIETASNSIVEVIDDVDGPYSFAFTSDGDYAYVVCRVYVKVVVLW
jgi:YVTN family beta-propeller protein